MLISFSGPDGAGKSTQISRILSYFHGYGFKVGRVQDVNPAIRYQLGEDLTYYYEYLRQFDVIHTRFRLHSVENVEIMDIVQYIATGNRWMTTFSAYTSHYDAGQWYKYVTEPLLKENKILIADKYAFDDIAFKTAYGCDYDWLRALHHDMVIPDIAIYLKVCRDTILRHNEFRKDRNNILYKNAEDTQRLLNAYECITRDYPVKGICADDTEDIVFNKVLEYLKSFPAFSKLLFKQ